MKKPKFCQYVVACNVCCASAPEEGSIYCKFHTEIWPLLVEDADKILEKKSAP